MITQEEFDSIKLGDFIVDTDGGSGIVVSIGRIFVNGPIYIDYCKNGDWAQDWNMIEFRGNSPWIAEWHPNMESLSKTVDIMVDM